MALGLGLSVTLGSELLVAASFRAAYQAQYAAEGALEVAIGDLLREPDWRPLPGGTSSASFASPAGGWQAPDGASISVADLTAELQEHEGETTPAGPNHPIWRLYGHADWSRLVPGVDAGIHVIVWVADDPGETDANPLEDSNGTLRLRAEAYGQSGARRGVEALVGPIRGGPSSGRRTELLTVRSGG